MDCGTGAGMVRSEDRVELGRWNEVVVERFEKEMAVSIDAGVKSFGYTKVGGEKGEGGEDDDVNNHNGKNNKIDGS